MVTGSEDKHVKIWRIDENKKDGKYKNNLLKDLKDIHSDWINGIKIV